MKENTDEGFGCLLICIGIALVIFVIAWATQGLARFTMKGKS